MENTVVNDTIALVKTRLGPALTAGVAGAILFIVPLHGLAQDSGGDIVFSLEREQFSFGRPVPLYFDFTCENLGLSPVEVEDDGGGQLAFSLGIVNFPTVGCAPFEDASWNLKDLFNLMPGDYTLTVRQPGGDQLFNFTVRDSVLDSGPAQTGSWFDPAQNGQGLSLEVFSDGRAIAYWYAYDDEGDNLWLLGDGHYDGDELVFDVFEADGEGFPPNYRPGTHELDPWGEMTLALDSCRAGTLSWTTTSAGFEDGSMPLQRISPANPMPCFDDDLAADSWRTVNLLADDPELDFELLNASLDGDDNGGDWALAFEELPAALGTGRALTARPVNNNEFARFFLGTSLAGSDRRELEGNNQQPPYAVLAAVTVALPGNQACEALDSVSLTVSFMDRLWDRASEEAQTPLFDMLYHAYRTLPLGSIGVLRNDDCTAVDDFLVRTFVSSAVLPSFDARWATLTVDLGNLDPDSDEPVVGPVYLLDFQVRGRMVTP